jgi:hypothetical protein
MMEVGGTHRAARRRVEQDDVGVTADLVRKAILPQAPNGDHRARNHGRGPVRRNGLRHWSILCIGDTAQILSTYAKDARDAGRIQVNELHGGG